MSSETQVYTPKHPIRVITATSLYDGHDAAINIIRRILQDTGAEVIHLGHNRSVQEIVEAAVQEDAQGIAVSSYQGAVGKCSVRRRVAQLARAEADFASAEVSGAQQTCVALGAGRGIAFAS